MIEPMKLLSAEVVEQLLRDVDKNVERYKAGNFLDLEKANGWAIQATFAHWDTAIAGKLNPEKTVDAEINNSLLIYKGTTGITPAMAREERLWTRLCHVECLDYARQRWLRHDQARQARLHFFALGLPACRDDNAIGRLWWNGHIAALASPDDIEFGLKRLLARANIRLQIMDRADTSFRQPLIKGIVRLLGQDSWFDSYDAAIADFMFEVNKRSGGIMFEALPDEQVYAHLVRCLEIAKNRRPGQAKAA